MKVVYMSSMTRCIIDNSHISEWNIISSTIFFCFGNEKFIKQSSKRATVTQALETKW
jgi:hypothetical protein